jgi:hypothetical protein
MVGDGEAARPVASRAVGRYGLQPRSVAEPSREERRSGARIVGAGCQFVFDDTEHRVGDGEFRAPPVVVDDGEGGDHHRGRA